MKTIGIIGTRGRNTKKDFDAVEKKFLEIYNDGDHIVSGGCPQGGDRFAEVIAKKHQVPIKIHYAQWNKFGETAGFKRNTDIARESVDLIACVDPNRRGGTEDTIKKFEVSCKKYAINAEKHLHLV
jgi:hypothetical protein